MPDLPAEPHEQPAEQATQAGSRSAGDEVPQAKKRKRKGTYTGELRVLRDGTIAHRRDYGNYDGVKVTFDFPDGNDTPSAHVVEPLEVKHEGVERMRRNGEEWHKSVAGRRRDGSDRAPRAERDDAEDRYDEAVRRLIQERSGRLADEGPESAR